MASVVDICNLALSRLGDSATVSSIDPPEGSAQAEHCARFYPIARDFLLEKHDWGFAVKRVALAAVTNPLTEWQYAYATPSDSIRICDVHEAGASSEYGVFVAQDFSTETLMDGSKVIFTNAAGATARYVPRITDPTRYSPMFVDALAWLLASYLAGPVIKGSEGMNVGRACLGTFDLVFRAADVSDSNQQWRSDTHTVSWMGGR